MSFFLTLAVVTVLQQQIDGTALTFTIEKSSIAIQVGRWQIKTSKTEEMNRFVDLHLKEIDPNKIVVYGDAKATYPTFKPVMDVLKKHDWLKFRLEPTGQKPKSAVRAVDIP